MNHKTVLLEPDCFYHIYNRANGSEKIFLSDENYRFFLQQFDKYLSPYIDLFSYCLMSNHFHFLVRIRSQDELVKAIETTALDTEQLHQQNNKPIDLSKFMSKQFSKLFSSYTQAFNKQQARMGSLFMKNFKRKQVNEDRYLRELIRYIHRNPIEARLVDQLSDWRFSSYQSIISTKPTKLEREEIIELFDDRSNFIHNHQ